MHFNSIKPVAAREGNPLGTGENFSKSPLPDVFTLIFFHARRPRMQIRKVSAASSGVKRDEVIKALWPILSFGQSVKGAELAAGPGVNRAVNFPGLKLDLDP